MNTLEEKLSFSAGVLVGAAAIHVRDTHDTHFISC